MDVADADEVGRNWESIKASEKGRDSVLEGIPLAMPALALADKTVTRSVSVGITPTVTGGIGDRLLGLVVEAGALGVDPEQELRDAVRRLADDVRAAESG